MKLIYENLDKETKEAIIEKMKNTKYWCFGCKKLIVGYSENETCNGCRDWEPWTGCIYREDIK